MKNAKALYVGKDGKPVKVWDKEEGVLDRELFEYACLHLFKVVS